MGTRCPHMSYYQYNTISVSAKPVSGSVVTGSEAMAFQITSIDGGSDTINGAWVWKDCITTDCKIWDATNGRCGMQVTDTIVAPSDESNHIIANLEGVVGKIAQLDVGNTLIQYLQKILGIDGEARESLMKIVEHKHNMHSHPYLHDSSVMSYNNIIHGDIAGGPAANVLMTEYLNSEDTDKITIVSLQSLNPEITGSIYGKHFKIREDDQQCPEILKSIHRNPEFPVNRPLLSWPQYSSLVP